ncbi:hypothetical protein TNCV_3183251 [Trichonephila clavipes]|uniref:Uncharacterized protein n=1 Tax=Trichonephila clavipes TaxID=2585209 RepID=A0A8X6SLZ1_TRICX|nr:hypothetical protein TNCV_3183251 [Trichonephila clavipes]
MLQVVRVIKLSFECYVDQAKLFRIRYTPTTSRTQNVPLTTKRYHQHVTPTKVKYVTIPVPVQTFTDVKNQTEVGYVWKEVKVKEVFFEVPLPVTEVFHYVHKVDNYWDHLEPTTAEIEIIQPEKPCENRYSDWFQVKWNCSMAMSLEDITAQCGECETVNHIECRIRNPAVTDYEYITCNNQEGFRCMDVCRETYTGSCCCNEYEIRVHCGCGYEQHIEKPTPKYNEYIAEVQHQRYTYPPFVPERKVYEVQG